MKQGGKGSCIVTRGVDNDHQRDGDATKYVQREIAVGCHQCKVI